MSPPGTDSAPDGRPEPEEPWLDRLDRNLLSLLVIGGGLLVLFFLPQVSSLIRFELFQFADAPLARGLSYGLLLVLVIAFVLSAVTVGREETVIWRHRAASVSSSHSCAESAGTRRNRSPGPTLPEEPFPGESSYTELSPPRFRGYGLRIASYSAVADFKASAFFSKRIASQGIRIGRRK